MWNLISITVLTLAMVMVASFPVPRPRPPPRPVLLPPPRPVRPPQITQRPRPLVPVVPLVHFLRPGHLDNDTYAENTRECYHCSSSIQTGRPEPFTDKCQDPAKLTDLDKDFITNCYGPCLKEIVVWNGRDQPIIIRRRVRNPDEVNRSECWEGTKSDDFVHEICPCFDELCNNGNSDKCMAISLLICTVAAKLIYYWF